jgi:hypothetical protein
MHGSSHSNIYFFASTHIIKLFSQVGFLLAISATLDTACGAARASSAATATDIIDIGYRYHRYRYYNNKRRHLSLLAQ